MDSDQPWFHVERKDAPTMNCFHCKRVISPYEDKYRDFDMRIFCKDCFKGTITTLPKHGEKK